MIQTHRCDICGDLATEGADNTYRCDKPECIVEQLIRESQ